MNRKMIHDVWKVAFSLALGVLILWWMYRGMSWDDLWTALRSEMKWGWLWLSMPFGILAQVFRALRWRQALEPVCGRPRLSASIYAVFVSYASSLILPRAGEVLRCAVLKRTDGTPFATSLGTVVTERIIDSVFMVLLALFAACIQIKVFMSFFAETGMSFDALFGRFTAAGWWVTAACLVVLVCFIVFLARRWAWFSHTTNLLRNLVDGILSLRNVKSVPLYLTYSLLIWAAYFLHFYLTFFCFAFTEQLGWAAAMAAFVTGSFAVIVPTPNGAGPWHFAVKTILVLYGVAEADGVLFVLIIHSLQTLLVALLGLYGMGALAFMRKVPAATK